MCFFATVVVVVAIMFIAWLVRFRETGKYTSMGSADVQCGAVLARMSCHKLVMYHSISLIYSLWLLLLEIFFFLTTLIPHLPLPSLLFYLLSFCPSYFLFCHLISHFLAAIVKISQLGHSAVFCLGGIALQLSWVAYLGPITPTRCMVRPWLLGAYCC